MVHVVCNNKTIMSYSQVSAPCHLPGGLEPETCPSCVKLSRPCHAPDGREGEDNQSILGNHHSWGSGGGRVVPWSKGKHNNGSPNCIHYLLGSCILHSHTQLRKGFVMKSDIYSTTILARDRVATWL